MELNWLQSLAMGLVSGLTDVLPVSSQAHQTLLFTCFGGTGIYPVTRLVIHTTVLITLLVCCWGQIGRIRRQLRLLRLPKRRRNRPVDMASVMDAKILKTAFWPMLVCLLLFGMTRDLGSSLLWTAAACLVNGLILYLPSLFPTANKDSRLVTPGESLQMGLGIGAAVLPGISSVGASYSVGILHGIDHRYMIHLTLMMHMMYTVGMMVYDVLDILALGAVSLHAGALLRYGLTAAATAVGAAFGVRVVRFAAGKSGLVSFSFYSIGVALFAFILYLMV